MQSEKSAQIREYVMKLQKSTYQFRKHYSINNRTLRVASVFILIAACFSKPVLAETDFIKVGELAPEFQIADQYGEEHSLSELSGKVVVLFYTGKDKSQKAAEIGKSLNTRFNEYAEAGKNKKIEIIAAGYLKGVPGFLKKTVKGYIKEKKLDGKPDPTPLLLDWSGTIAKHYGYNKSEVNVFVIGKDGKIYFAGTVVVEDDKNKVVEIISKLVEEKNK